MWPNDWDDLTTPEDWRERMRDEHEEAEYLAFLVEEEARSASEAYIADAEAAYIAEAFAAYIAEATSHPAEVSA